MIVFLLLIGSCTKEKAEFCSDCKVNEIPDNYVELTEGWLCFYEDLERFIICTPSYNMSFNYCPCVFPDYFAIVDNQPVRFKGYKTESPVLKSSFSEVTCIRLDTIYNYEE